ncbi:MAG TPA: FAD-binding domain-containing protein [Geminicoccaceae bacterium]|nr:FAD-binding domain-containing protein [Geminicoccaceae bacterium]
MPRRPVQIVWLKCDLRVADHAPLAEAAGRGPVLPLFVVEPGYRCEPDASGRQFAFLAESLVELRAALAALGQPLVVRVGEAVDVLEDLRRCLPVGALWSHEETGNGWTYARDREVHAWARAHGVPWHERRQTGVIRRLGSHDGWADRWDRFMRRPIVQVPLRLLPVPALEPGPIPSADAPGLPADSCPQRQPGGRAAGREALRSFLAERGRPYQRAMSSPTVGALHCSRLSPHLTWGTVSVREALQAAEARLAGLAPDERHPWQGALGSFIGRLHWHCHFVQKLETEPAIEHRSLHPAYDGLRGNDETRLAAWSEGRTGWPFVDACMRMLHATGWLNFRMRAMVMSVAAHQLWLDWRSAGPPLARLFTDYEPGIHWPQCQMQSGATGTNTIRIYNPVKQGHDHDPDGAFIRRWCPELARVPTRWIHTPWTMPALEQAEAGCRIGRDYPAPIIDHVAAARAARDAVWAVRRRQGFARAADAIQARHGSRRSGLPQPDELRARAKKRAEAQLELGL